MGEEIREHLLLTCKAHTDIRSEEFAAIRCKRTYSYRPYKTALMYHYSSTSTLRKRRRLMPRDGHRSTVSASSHLEQANFQ
ncbi:hypothetical protein DPMN_037410 [Dreissena polymorpha]|uniref:Uncharacterized protein n=1 Tax=Dreissena polymorpha TaxID=45954 RepID=A0A9D4RP40_DREPO|nr:hypothetical protein DPMN_037410 [Dreissena polymorpha]